MRFFVIGILFSFLIGCSILNLDKTNSSENEISQSQTEEKSIIDSLNNQISKHKSEIDSLYFVIDYLYAELDSLSEALEYSENRLAIDQNFIIPESIIFAGEIFNLKNERIYDKFEEIFNNELKNAHKFIPRSGTYFPVFDSIFAKHNIPLDTKYLAIAESALNSMATSHVGAGGIWQFMPSTAKGYNLKIDSFVDERRNVYKATEAAAKYLNNSHNYLKKYDCDDWLLSMCAYNAGPGSIGKVIKTQGGKSFFDLILRVDETNKYLWRAVAIKMIFENEEKLFGKKFPRDPSLFDLTKNTKLVLKGHYKIDEWAKAQGTVVSKVWEYNPWIKIYQRKRKKYSPINDVVLPPGEYTVLLPANIEKNENALASIEQTFLKKNAGYFQYHIVKSGDNLYNIARKYKTTVTKIKQINGLTKNTIHPGQKLKLYGSSKPVVVKSKVYVVKSGDSISKIASKLGVSSNNLISKNNLKKKSSNGKKIVMIYPGQKLYY